MSTDEKPLNEDRDAARWARKFNDMQVSHGEQPVDHITLLAWFANAMMCGEDTYRWQQEKAVGEALLLAACLTCGFTYATHKGNLTPCPVCVLAEAKRDVPKGMELVCATCRFPVPDSGERFCDSGEACPHHFWRRTALAYKEAL